VAADFDGDELARALHLHGFADGEVQVRHFTVRVEHLDQDVVYFLPFHFDLFPRFRPMVSQNLRSPVCVAFQADVF